MRSDCRLRKYCPRRHYLSGDPIMHSEFYDFSRYIFAYYDFCASDLYHVLWIYEYIIESKISRGTQILYSFFDFLHTFCEIFTGFLCIVNWKRQLQQAVISRNLLDRHTGEIRPLHCESSSSRSQHKHNSQEWEKSAWKYIVWTK